MIIPQFQEPGLTKFILDLDREITRQQQDTLSAVTANRSVLLYSPNKSVFELTVDNAGALHITKVAG